MTRGFRVLATLFSSLAFGIAFASCSNGSTSSTPAGPVPTPKASPLLLVGDFYGRVYAYTLATSGAPAPPTQYSIPNVAMAVGGGVLATVGDSTLKVIFPQTFSGTTTVGLRIDEKKLGIYELNTALAVDPSANIYAISACGLIAVKGVPGTTGLLWGHQHAFRRADRCDCRRTGR